MKFRIKIGSSRRLGTIDRSLFDQVEKAVDPSASQQRLIDQIATRYEGDLREAFVDAINTMTGDDQLQALADAISAQDWPQVQQLTGIEAYRLAINNMQAVLLDAFTAAGTQMAGLIASGKGIGPTSINVAFDRLNPASIRAMKRLSDSLAQSLQNDTSATVLRILQEQVSTGGNPRAAAAKIKKIIGLNDQQATALMNYEQALRSGSWAQAASYGISDADVATIDPSARKKPLPEASVQRLTENYRRRLLGVRADTIARTESMSASSEGGAQAWTQAISASGLPPENFRRFWVATNDSRTRHDHREIPRLNAQGVGLNEPFVYPGGTIMRPHDPSAPASQVVNCRCTQVIRYVPPTMVAPLPVVAGSSILPE